MIRAAWWAVPLAGLLTGCGDPCDPNKDVGRCEGNTTFNCPQPGVDQLVGANRWVSHACAGAEVCVVAESAAFCALSATPAPACADAGDGACDSQTSKVYCQAGFATGQSPCLSCQATDAGDAHCEGGQSAACTSSSQCAPGLTCSGRGYCGSGSSDAG